MADKQVIAATLSVDTGNSNANIKEVNKNLNEVKGSLNSTGATAAATGKTIDNSTGSFGKLKNQMSSLPGPLGQAGEGVGKLNTAFKALLANPVGLVILAIVAALALLYKAFTNTFEGGQKMEQVFAGIKAAGQSLIDSLEKIGSAIVKVFKFDFSGAIKDIKGVAQAAGDAFGAMAKLTQQAQGLHKEQLANDLDQAERAKKLAILREQATDEDIPRAKRKAALKELQADAEQNAKDDIDLAKRTTDNRIAQLTLQKDGAKKNQDEITKLKIDQINVETENANELRRINKQITTSDKQEAAERKAIAKEETDRQKENIAKAKEHAIELKKLAAERVKQEKATAKAIAEGRAEDLAGQIEYGKQLAAEQAKIDAGEIKRVFDNEQTRLKNKKKLAELNTLNNPEDPKSKIELLQAQLELENSVLEQNDLQRQINVKKNEDDINIVTKNAANARMQIAEIETEHRKQQANEVGNTLNALSELVGKQTVAGKALAIATALINTYQGASEAIKQKSTLPSPFDVIAKVANVAAIIGVGLKTVKSIVAVQVPGGGGGGASVSAPSISAPAPVSPTQQGVQLNQDNINSLGSAVGNQRAYVVDSDIKDHQERATRLNRAARLGG